MRLEFGQITDHIAFLDNGLLDLPRCGATYIVRGDEYALVETGTTLCVPSILQGLAALDVNPCDIRHIVLTHVHMDHAGGAGLLVDSMPDARVYLHSMTHEHLVEPSRLIRSAERALGDLFPKHGTIVPLSSERLYPAENLVLDLGQGITLRAIATPGHSSDHLAYYETSSAALFSGDSAGIVLPSYAHLGPVTPPPALDIEAQRRTFQTLLDLPVEHLLFSHYGPSPLPAREVLERLQESFERFAALIRVGLEAGTLDDAAIVQAMLPAKPLDAAANWVIVEWIRMSVRGMVRYFTQHKAV
jgi:glyoxylase-like metal-dependent hydrolase (beta-lactamase superfamily II)